MFTLTTHRGLLLAIASLALMGAVLHAQPEPVSNAQLTQDVLRTVRAARQKATVTIDLKVYKEPPTQMFVFVTPA